MRVRFWRLLFQHDLCRWHFDHPGLYHSLAPPLALPFRHIMKCAATVELRKKQSPKLSTGDYSWTRPHIPIHFMTVFETKQTYKKAPSCSDRKQDSKMALSKFWSPLLYGGGGGSSNYGREANSEGEKKHQKRSSDHLTI